MIRNIAHGPIYPYDKYLFLFMIDFLLMILLLPMSEVPTSMRGGGRKFFCRIGGGGGQVYDPSYISH